MERHLTFEKHVLVRIRLLLFTKAPHERFVSLVWARWTNYPVVRGQLVLLLGCSGHDPKMELDTKVSISLMWPTCASSYEEQGDLNGKKHAHTGDTEKVGVLCAFWSDGSAHLTWRTSSRSLPSYSGRAFHLCVFSCGLWGESSWCRFSHNQGTRSCALRRVFLPTTCGLASVWRPPPHPASKSPSTMATMEEWASTPAKKLDGAAGERGQALCACRTVLETVATSGVRTAAGRARSRTGFGDGVDWDDGSVFAPNGSLDVPESQNVAWGAHQILTKHLEL